MKNEIEVPGFASMQMFSEYKKSSCLLECQAKELIHRYGCLPYYMPTLPAHFIRKHKPPKYQRKKGSEKKGSTVCSSSQLKIMSKEITKLSALQPSTGDTPDMGLIEGLSCPHPCPDECEFTDYSTQVSYADFVDTGNFFYQAILRKGTKEKPAVNEALFKEYEMYVKDIFAEREGIIEVKGPPVQTKDPRPSMKSCLETTVKNKIGKMSYLHVYFKNFGVAKFSRNEVYGWQDLIAFFGGIVGLCVGFSLLSGAELVYFFTLRLLFQYRTEKKKVGPEDIENFQQQQFWDDAFTPRQDDAFEVISRK